MELLILWLVFGILAAVVANGKNRSTGAWFVLGALFGPFALVVGLLPRLPDSVAMARKAGIPGATVAERLRPCPYCAEQIQPAAIKCRFCGESVPPESEAASQRGYFAGVE